ncbi:E3 ubiquitin-protein ligase TRIM7-like [Boleophthalmus pectinirostris]|uniref:E3 ubiquitin-protein ligase TRIM7-like n=1 Tax=Boleophthalmus pectinirostris TaxID=150288 RepID=UPI00243052E8|nr:E3 ubiquitin-protein ligase TRIM7-like [Boleophthalmus pectinirostris]
MSLDGGFLTDDEFLCSICLDLFTNPASTPCGHSFCLSCISKYWEGAKVCQCPLCKKTYYKKPDLQINRTLREITEHFKSMKEDRIDGPRETTQKRGKSHPRNNLLNHIQKKLSKPFHHQPRNERMAISLPETENLLIPHEQRRGSSSSSSTRSSSSHRGSSPSSRRGSSPLSNGSSPPEPGSSPLPWSPASDSPPPRPPPRFKHAPRRFTLSGAEEVHNLPLCPAHGRAIMLYCQTDQMCICPECEEEDHPDHDVISIETQWKETKVYLSSLEKEVDDMIKERVTKLSEIRESMSQLEVSVQRQTAGSLSFFSALVSSVERAQSDLLETLETKRRAAELQAETSTRQIQLELDQLRTRHTQIRDLSRTEDHIEGLKTLPSLWAPPLASDWTRPCVTVDLGAEAVYRSLSLQLQKFQDELQTVAETGFPDSVLESSLIQTQPRDRGVQEYAVDVTLDVSTAHPRLVLSEDLKSVRYGDRPQMLPDNPERFDRVVCVLGQQEISSGRHYWEVEVGGKTDWDLGVAKRTINRKGKLEVTPANGYWFLSLRDQKSCTFRTQPSTDVNLPLHPNKIGIFVDYENGQVSFYNVDAKTLIYTFNDWFGDSIFPFFSPCTSKNGKNEAPLVITPVNVSDY